MNGRSRDRAATVALLSLAGLGPARYDALMAAFDGPAAAWRAVQQGALASVPLPVGPAKRTALLARWRTDAAAVDPADLLRRHREVGIRVVVPDDVDWPTALRTDPAPPAALFVRGDLGHLDGPTVGVVGTRRCTAAGRAVAAGIGRGLAAAGIPVVSGLALGIDGIAHRAVLERHGTPIGVVASGLDRVYPTRHRDLWTEVGRRGLLLSESALGVDPERWRFPARNRIIAACSTVLVVVESDVRGGSMSTAAAALDRQTDVLAVPGSVHSPQSAGTNQLLYDGAGVARDVADVLTALGITTTAPPSSHDPGGVAAAAGIASRVDPAARAVAAALSPTPTSVDRIIAATELDLAAVMTALARLEVDGIVRRDGPGYRLSVR